MGSKVEIIVSAIDKSSATLGQVDAKYKAFSDGLTKRAQSYMAIEKQRAKAIEDTAKAAAQANEKGKFSFTELSSAIGLAGQALQKLKEGYEFAKEGAQIEFTAQKFERLAATIGTTGDALQGKLLEATKGTLSEMQAMAMATDLVSLGLVKTEEDTVRLSAVVAGLGMDMNQLVLTLANQTTMRFDQLGVAVVGFDEKVKALEETGMDTNAAFTEAFLQQAEEQLKKVGNAADTNVGQFMKLEAAWKDFTDNLKIGTANAVVPVIETLNEMSSASERVDEQYGNLTPRARNFMTVLEMQTGAIQANNDYIDEYTAMMEGATRAQVNYTGAITETNTALPLTAEQIKVISEANTLFLGVLGNVTDAQTTYYDGLRDVNQQLADGKITTEEHSAKIGQLAEDYRQASADIVLSIVEMKLAQDGWTDAELNAYLRVGQAQGKFTEDQVNMAQGAIEQANEMVASFDAMGDQAEHTGERAADAAVGFGIMADAAVGLEDKVRPAAAAVGGLKSQLNGLPADGTAWRYDFIINVQGQVPRVATASYSTSAGYNTNVHAGEDSGRDSGGPGEAGHAYMIGAGAQPEMFVPSTDGQFIPNADKLFDTSGIIAAIQAIPRMDEKRFARALDMVLQQRGY